jgi:hypothetical protein
MTNDEIKRLEDLRCADPEDEYGDARAEGLK